MNIYTEHPPPDVVRIYATVEYMELQSGLRRRVSIVPPAEADAASGRISLLSPVGRALLGRSVNQISEALLPDGRSLALKIESVRQH